MKDLTKLDWNELRLELEKCEHQFRVLHQLSEIPSSNLEMRALYSTGNKPIRVSMYMEAALEGVRSRCIAIHWRQIQILQEWQKYLASSRSSSRMDQKHPVELQHFSEIMQECIRLKCSIRQFFGIVVAM
jgi:hypothetical protein